MEVPSNQNPHSVIYLYCRHDKKWTIAEYLASLVAQLLRSYMGISTVPEAVYKLYNLHFPQGTKPSKVELANLLRNLVPVFNKVYIVLDALDEVQDCDQIELMANIRSIGGLLLTLRSTGVEVFDLPHHTLHVSIGHQNQEDINTYLHERVKQITSVARIVRGRESFTEEVCEKILNMSNGMYVVVIYVLCLHLMFNIGIWKSQFSSS